MTQLPETYLTKEDFAGCDWKSVIQDIEKPDSMSLSAAFRTKLHNVTDIKEEEVFRLLDLLMTSRLHLNSVESPFGNLDRFHDSHLALFKDIIDDDIDAEVKARMADLLWLRTKDYKMAEIAVESYLASARILEDFEQWTQTARRVERALQLAGQLGKSRELYQIVLEHLFDLVERCNGEDPLYLSAELMRLLIERGQGVDKSKTYANMCEKLAQRAEKKNNFDLARRYWETKAEWHFLEKDPLAAKCARFRSAETYEKESDYNLENRSPKFLMASYPLEQAIVAYRKAEAPSETIDLLKLKLRDYQRKGVEEMVPISGGPVDITDVVSKVQETISGKTLADALRSLALFCAPSNVVHVRQEVEQNRARFVFSTLFPKKLFSSSGRAVAVQPTEGEEAILADMFQYASHAYELNAKAYVEPGRLIIIREHSVRVFEFYDLLMNHPYIPDNREFIVARGLHAGLVGDFLVATHLLIPQIEESFRQILMQRGMVPTSFDDRGVQDEFNLNKLLTNPKFTVTLETIFGKDLVFELRGLLVERFGANLRNDMAHGLIDHQSFYSYAAMFFWGLSLRFYLLPMIVSDPK